MDDEATLRQSLMSPTFPISQSRQRTALLSLHRPCRLLRLVLSISGSAMERRYSSIDEKMLEWRQLCVIETPQQ
jgi:hypothetical protein